MLESMRAVQNTWVGKAAMGLIFVLIIVGLSFFGFADLFRSATATYVARVGSTDITVDAFRQAYQNNLNQLQQRLRRQVTNVQARQMGLDQQVLSRLVTDAVLDDEAHKLGLAISDPQIAKVITQDPTFAGQNGQFDRAKFTQLLRDNGMTEQSFVRDQRNAYLRQEVVDAVAGVMTAPKIALEAFNQLQTETRSIDMLVLPGSLITDVATPEPAVLQTYYDQHKAAFAAPEYRKLTVLAVTPADVAKPDAITDEELHKAYDANPDNRFGTAERRTLQQIVFPSQQEAEAAALRIKAGTPFAAIASERKVSGKDLDLGTLAKSEIFDKPIADAAFALPSDGTSDPITGSFGTVLVHVAGIEPGNQKPFDEVAPTLRKELAESPAKAGRALRDLRDKVEDERASGKTLTEAAQGAGLKVRTIDAIDATGHDRSGALVNVPERDALLRAAFASDVGVDNDVIQGRDGNEVWFEVQGVDAAHQRPFDEVKSEVEAAWRKDETAKRLAAKAEEVRKSIADGATLEKTAESLGNLPIKNVNNLRRAGTPGVSAAVAQKAFETPVQGVALAAGDDGTEVVFKVLGVVVPPFDATTPQSKQMADQFSNVLADDLLTAFLAHVQGAVGIKVNMDALNNAVGGAS